MKKELKFGSPLVQKLNEAYGRTHDSSEIITISKTKDVWSFLKEKEKIEKKSRKSKLQFA